MSSIWSRGGLRGGGNGSYSNRPTSNSASTSNSNNNISSEGFRKAKGQIGKIPTEMELLQSPSRGLDTSDASSLKNPEIQNRFRQHITEKLIKFDLEFKEPVLDPISKASALSIILLDFRKLREGLTSSGRVDLFAAEVYESSARLAIYAGNMQQLGACLPHLVFSLHPALLLPSTSTSTTSVSENLASLSLSSPTNQEKLVVVIPELHSFYQSLYLLYLISHLSDLMNFHSTLSIFQTTSNEMIATDLQFVIKVYTSLISSNFINLSKLIYPQISTSTTTTKTRLNSSLPPLSPKIKLDLQLTLLKSSNNNSILNWRENSWKRIEKSYKLFHEDLIWLSKILLFEPGDIKSVEKFLKEKGK